MRLFFTVDARVVKRALGVGAGALVLASLPWLWDTAVRLRYGVKPGVTLAGQAVGWLLPEELHRRLDEMGRELDRPARDAKEDATTGRVVPEAEGRELDRAATARKLLAAPPFARVEPVFTRLLPAVTRLHYQAIYQGPPGRPLVAFAINVDWGEEVLPALLDRLEQEKVRATFFVTGRWAQKFPELVRRMRERGHEVGNHGWDHAHPRQLGDPELRALIAKNADLLEQLTGRRPTLFAPPYGEVDARIVRVAAEQGHYTTMWSVDTIDWQRPPVETILARVERKLGPGAIVLMHPTQPTLEALPRLVALVRQRSLTPVTVGQMVAALEEEGQAAAHTSAGP
ncbi:MAG: polysaccharide deacetylase family protein [Limnochordaceae bacterium]|nr:polysaccharide deacetylase family protein [Limnochordaceae bacterium]